MIYVVSLRRSAASSTTSRVNFCLNYSPHSTLILQDVLQTAGCDVHLNFKSGKSVAEFMEILAAAHHETMRDGKLETTFPTPVHCECQLLASLHARPALPYIGVSKSSCVFCDDYFAVYREKTKSALCTRGTHGQTAPWTCPTLNDPAVDMAVREAVCSNLLARIRKGWEEYRRSPLSSKGSDVVLVASCGPENLRLQRSLDPHALLQFFFRASFPVTRLHTAHLSLPFPSL
ncbi:hypothetical protein B0H19DRAFT_1107727 [Mycena capillaripes]|nr:hypothetical protein B0H19DRAFT_1107727 [Mycena capillaripes]